MEKLNSTQLSKAFSVSLTTIKNWVNRGIPHEKTNKGLLFVLSDCIAWHQKRFVRQEKENTGLQESRALKEHFKAKLTELEYKERSGELVSAKGVKEAAFEKARQVRDSFLNIPARVSPILAAETNAKKVHSLLDKEIRQVLEALSGDLKQPPEGVKNETANDGGGD